MGDLHISIRRASADWTIELSIVTFSPHLHGRDLIAPLSTLLSITSNEAASVLLSALESVRFLIAEDILDFPSFVRKFNHFENDPRFLVKSGFLKLYGKATLLIYIKMKLFSA